MNTIMNVFGPSRGHFNVTLYETAGHDSSELPGTNSCEL